MWGSGFHIYSTSKRKKLCALGHLLTEKYKETLVYLGPPKSLYSEQLLAYNRHSNQWINKLYDSFLGLCLYLTIQQAFLKAISQPFLFSSQVILLHFGSSSLLFSVHSLDKKSYLFYVACPKTPMWILKTTQVQNCSGFCLLCLPALIKYKLEEIFSYFSCLLSCLSNAYWPFLVWRAIEKFAVWTWWVLQIRMGYLPSVQRKQNMNFEYRFW